MPETHSESNGVTFNERVEDTAFAGRVSARLDGIEKSVDRIDVRTESMWTTQQRFLGIVGIASLLVPVIASIILRAVWQ